MSELNFERSSDYSWDLQAIVKGVSSSYNWVEFDDQEYYQNQETNATKLLNDLHQLCNSNLHNISNISSSEIGNYTAITTLDDQESSKCSIEAPTQEIKDDVSCASNTTIAPKRRRNKNKKTTVQQATGDRILSDKWNWRKYGEKVIKGSPYPRSYYRCSNAKGCLARKQVEQSCKDAGKFLITYIDEHNHTYPSRRPSQAGRTSRRLHASSNQVLTTNETLDLDMSSTTTRAMAPSIVEWDNGVDRNNVGCVGVAVGEEGSYGSNCVFEDDFFRGLEYLEGLDMDFITHNTASYSDHFLFK